MLVYAIFICSIVSCNPSMIGHDVPYGDGYSFTFASRAECLQRLRETVGEETDNWRCLGRRIEVWQ